MDDIQAMHNLNLEWGCITNLMDHILTIEETIDGGWPELSDMVIDAVSEEGENKDPASAFFNLYVFLWRLFYRLKVNPSKRPFNKVGKTEVMGEECFSLQNYDYATFKWLKAIGCGDKISNDYATIPMKQLTDKQRRTLERRVKEAK